MASAAINNFTSARIVDGKLVVQGQTVKRDEHGETVKVTLPAGAKIDGAAVSVDDRRCDLRVANPTGSSWTAESVGSNPFVNHDHIQAIGLQRAQDGSIKLLWVSPLCVGAPDPEL